MVSKMAKETIESMWAEGLKPTVEDIVRLNQLGLAAEHYKTGGLAAVPRVARLGELAFVEPSLAKRIYLDTVEQAMVEESYLQKLALAAYVLNTPSEELPSLEKLPKIFKAVDKFLKTALLPFTETEISAAIEYACVGESADVGEFPEASAKEKEAAKNAKDLVGVIGESKALALLDAAVEHGVDYFTARDMTTERAANIIIAAAIAKGADGIKAIKRTRFGEFYRTADFILERLKNNGK